MNAREAVFETHMSVLRGMASSTPTPWAELGHQAARADGMLTILLACGQVVDKEYDSLAAELGDYIAAAKEPRNKIRPGPKSLCFCSGLGPAES